MKLLEHLRGLLRRKQPPINGDIRILAYCASNVGLGHYCRILRVLDEVKRQMPGTSILMATDARENTQAARSGVALLQLPRFRFLDHEKFKERPELLNIKSRELMQIRSTLLLTLGRSYQPHIMLLDTNPHGKRDEVLPLLRHLRRQPCRTLLMMRDIPMPPGEPFKFCGQVRAIRRHSIYYDRLLLAGDARFFDAASAYDWPADLRAKMAYLGFVVPDACAASRLEAMEPYAQLDPAARLVVVSFGGGWQAEHYAPPMLRGLELYRREHPEPVQMIMAVGPALSGEHFRTLRTQAEALGGIVIEHFSPHFSQLLSHADLAVLQAGSVPFQVLESNIPILLTHRPYKSREQEERARRLAQWPGVRLVEQETLTPADCAEWLAWGLGQKREARATGYNFNGIQNAAREVITQVEELRANGNSRLNFF